MEYSILIEAYDKIGATRKRLEMTDILIRLILEAPAGILDRLVYLSLGKLGPDYLGTELGLAEKLVLRAVAENGGAPLPQVEKMLSSEGDIGIVADVDKAGETLAVDYDGRLVPYLFSELDELSLAYAITVHKSQGSEYPCVVIALMTQHYPMLQRNLLYTAMTRGKRLVVIVGAQRALSVALENDHSGRRRSRLATRLGKSVPMRGGNG